MNNQNESWRERAERLVGPLQPYASTTLAASEIGQYGFCPQKWFLARCDVPVDSETEQRLEAGTRAHRRIGTRTDLIRTAEAARLWLLIAMAATIAIAAVLVIRGGRI